LLSQTYPDDAPGTVWNSLQTGLVQARNGGECGSLVASIDCQYFDLMNNMVSIFDEHFNSVDVDTKNYNSVDGAKTDNILEDYLPVGSNWNLLKSLVKSLL
jgi:hypothetical protein